MKYSKEFFYICTIICFIVFIDAYKERTRQQRFKFTMIGNNLGVFDTKSNKTYIQYPSKSLNYYLEYRGGIPIGVGGGIAGKDSTDRYTPSELFNLKH